MNLSPGGACLPIGRELADLPAGRQARWIQNMFTVYVIKSKNRNYLYVGLTKNLQDRLKRHNNGWEKTTKPYKPFKLVYTEEFKTRTEARLREKELKSGYGKEFIKSLL